MVIKMSKNTEFWNKKKIFITGHTGFKGSWLCNWLISMGAEIAGFSLKPETNPNLFYETKLINNINNTFGDIRDFESLLASIQSFKPEIIFHLAAQPLVKQSYQDPVSTYNTNVMGTVHLMEAAKKSKSVKTIVNVTSDKCYENRELTRGYAENDQLGGFDPYSNSKACSELVTNAYRNSFFNNINIGVATARAGNVIGGGDWAHARLIPDILRSIETKKQLIVRNPNSVRPWQHVLECLSGYLKLAEELYHDEKKFSGAWNFGPSNTDTKPVKWIIKKMYTLWGCDQDWKLDSSEYFHETNFLKLDNSKARNELQWRPKWVLPEALQKIVYWHSNWIKDGNAKELCEYQIQEYKM